MLYKREITQKIKEGLAHNASVAILGPRQVGKTTLALEVAKEIPAVYLDLEDADDLQKLEAPKEYLTLHSDKLVILDEIQRYPNLFMTLRGIIDQRRRDGKGKACFLLLGSASNDLLKQSSESLAGRITYLELSGLTPFEIEATNSQTIRSLWIRGGFPDSFNATDEKTSNIWRKNFIRTYLERDIPQIGPRIPSTTLMRFWTMLAHSQGETLNSSKLASSLDISVPTIGRYLDLLADLLLVRRLPPWFGNIKKRLVKSPRVYIRDSGILHSLLQIENYEQLLSNPILGKSWEGFVIETIITALPNHISAFFYRTTDGAEIDLLLEMKYGKYWAIEIKFGNNFVLKRGFHSVCENLGIERRFVIYNGDDIFPMRNGVMALPLFEFLKRLKENI